MAQVSVGSLEVVSEDCFQKRLEGMSSCQDCNARQIRPTTKSRRGQKSKKQKENRHEKSESNKKHRRRLYHSNAHDDFLGPRPEGIFDPGNHANPYRKNYSAMISNIERSQLCEAMNLNNAVLSVLEKAHQKSQLFEAMNLNNAVTYADDNVRLHVCQYPMNNTVPPIVNDLKKNNLNRICNNLLSKADSFESTEGETGSQVSSTEESDTSDMSKEELSSLVSYATGYSLTRYGCETSKCPECNATSTRVLRRGKLKPPTSRESSFSGNESDEDTGEKDVKPKIKDKPKKRFKREKSSPNSKQSKTASVSAQRQKVRKAVSISVAELGEAEPSRPAASHIGSSQIFTVTSSRPENRLPSIPTDSVYVDLTETNVDCFVYSYSAKQSDLNNHWCYPGPNSPNFWYYPHFPYYVHPAILNIPNFVSVPRPLCVPRNRDILKSQKTCMIPAQEIEHFTASQPPQRPWINLAHPERVRPVAVFTVMCYNVLCDKYCTSQLYGYCPSWALAWEYRKKFILDEIRHYNSDIISLQEVETEQFYNFFLPELKQDGYDGIFSPKSRAKTMGESERKHVDGCAIFFRITKFSLVKEHLMEFSQLAMAGAEGSHDMLNRVMTKDNIGLVAVLETKESVFENGVPPDNASRQTLVVATAHIHWDPEFSDVKLIQTMMMMMELKNIIEEQTTQLRPGANTAPDINSVPLILCGDLNSLPESGVVEYLVNGKISVNHDDFKDLQYDDCLIKLNMIDSTEWFGNNFRLSRSYDSEIMPYTNYTFDFKGIIDYILYSTDHMTALGVLGPIDPEWFRETKVIGCPHPHVPSDHFALLTELELHIQTPNQQDRSRHQFQSNRR